MTTTKVQANIGDAWSPTNIFWKEREKQNEKKTPATTMTLGFAWHWRKAIRSSSGMYRCMLHFFRASIVSLPHTRFFYLFGSASHCFFRRIVLSVVSHAYSARQYGMQHDTSGTRSQFVIMHVHSFRRYPACFLASLPVRLSHMRCANL